MKKHLNYIFSDVPDAEVVSLTINPDQPFFEPWLYSMINMVPDKVIWFFTVESTDIWDDHTFEKGNML